MTTAEATAAVHGGLLPPGGPAPTPDRRANTSLPAGPTRAFERATTPLRVESRRGRAAKRCFDLLIGIPLLVLALPVLALLAVAVRLSSPGPALFRQQRPGRGGETFTIYKLRTMRVDAEDVLFADPPLYDEFVANGYKLPLDRDPRVTPVGRFLRRTSLDELPQLINVVLGTMSLVGPRPVLLDQAEALYGEDIELYFAVKPGMTGLWQVSGRSSLTHEERAELDRQYVRCWTPALDVVLLARTVPAVLTARGAY